VGEGNRRRGLLEDSRLGLELAVTAAFEAVRVAVRALLLLPKQQKWESVGSRRHGGGAALGRSRLSGSKSGFSFDFGDDFPSGVRPRPASARRQKSGAGGASGLPRARSYGSLEGMQVWTVSDVILQVARQHTLSYL
jgi:hypothetical protein